MGALLIFDKRQENPGTGGSEPDFSTGFPSLSCVKKRESVLPPADLQTEKDQSGFFPVVKEVIHGQEEGQ